MLISLIESYACLAFETEIFVSMENVNKFVPDCTASCSKRKYPLYLNVFGNMKCKASLRFDVLPAVRISISRTVFWHVMSCQLQSVG